MNNAGKKTTDSRKLEKKLSRKRKLKQIFDLESDTEDENLFMDTIISQESLKKKQPSKPGGKKVSMKKKRSENDPQGRDQLTQGVER